MFLSAPRGGGGRGGAYDCYHLVQHFVRVLNLSKAILRRRRIWAHIIIALEDGLSTEIGMCRSVILLALSLARC